MAKAASIGEVQKIFDSFKAAFNKNDLVKSKSLLSALKLKLTEFQALPPTFSSTPSAKEELALARDILEHAVFLSIKLKDEVLFERNFLQLKTYYVDVRDVIKPSANEDLITGLNLLRLLVQNRIAEFHTELELIPSKAQKSACIQHAIQLEQWLMEGAYIKVLAARQSAPSEQEAYLTEKLMSTVRDEIAGCSERAYTHLSLADAKKMLLFSSDKEVLSYAAQHEWQVKDGAIQFQQQAEKASSELPSVELMNHSLTYARELDRIV